MKTRWFVMMGLLGAIGCDVDAAVGDDSVGAATPRMADGGTTSAATIDDALAAASGSRCTRTNARVTCAHERVEIDVAGTKRVVFYQVPLGNPPSGGWPVVITWQPSIYWAEAHWTGFTTIAGQVYATENIARLLDHGYAVITPQARQLANTVWESNVPIVNQRWEATQDHALVMKLFEQIASGFYGPLDPDNQFAMGMSSGGYMTSRMALSYADRFKALVIESGAWATCLGPTNTNPAGLICDTPSPLPAGHPPTLFVHGTADPIVPIFTMRDYYDQLVRDGIETQKIEVRLGSHVFFEVTPDAALAWFESHRR